MVQRARQTVSYLTRRFREVGLEPDARRGQNFLVDLNLIELLARSAELAKEDVVLEVGTGTGSLTTMLAEQAGYVVSVEVDAHLHQMASEELDGSDHVQLLRQDALRNKNRIDDGVIAAVERALEAIPGSRLKLCANLPYNIATPIISNLLRWEMPPSRMTVTIQKELADRVVARPSTKDYGALSVWVQSQCDAEIVRIMPPTVFWPRPKVHSAIIDIRMDPSKRARIDDLSFFHPFVRSLFFHRRKYLRSVLISAFKGRLDKSGVDSVLQESTLGPDSRAEQLSVDQILQLAARFQRRLAEFA